MSFSPKIEAEHKNKLEKKYSEIVHRGGCSASPGPYPRDKQTEPKIYWVNFESDPMTQCRKKRTKDALDKTSYLTLNQAKRRLKTRLAKS